MADYKELLRRAISALPENNGAARRAVYEKARSALVGQLRAIDPPLPARDITQHRLQLEDCIRQVEQEASEAIITLGRDNGPGARNGQTPVTPPAPKAEAPAAEEPEKPAEAATPPETARPAEETRPTVSSIEDIISQAAAAGSAEVAPVVPSRPVLVDSPAEPEPAESRPVEPKPERVLPAIVARAEAAKSGPTSPVPSSVVRSIDAPLKPPGFEPRREAPPAAANSVEVPMRGGGRVEPLMGGQAVARQAVATPLAVAAAGPVETALSSVREVEVEPDTSEAEGAIERAIETLDREARGEPTAPLPDLPAQPVERPLFGGTARGDAAAEISELGDSSFAAEPGVARGGAGLTIFLVVFVLLLAAVGGGGFWAWREGFVDLDQMFGRAAPLVAETAPPVQIEPPSAAPAGPVEAAPMPETEANGPGNTATTAASTEPTTALEGLEIEDRLEPTPEAVVPDGTGTALPSLNGEEEIKGEERLPDEDAAIAAAEALAASVDPAVLAGSQSLLLEAASDGRTSAVPFSGTVEWDEGIDEIGLPTLIGRANIPARNLGVSITIRKNADPSLPASHLMEVDFSVSDTFVGGTIAGLPGVLLKDAELVPGVALVGASARIVGNSFLFALSASAQDAANNAELLENRKWMDLAVIYGTGRNAIITLEKDDEAQALFDKVFAAWGQTASP